MNLYKVTFNGTKFCYILANSFAEVEEIWAKNPNRFHMQNIEQIDAKVYTMENPT